MDSQEYVIRKALNNGKTNEEIAKEYCVDIEYVEELAGTEYQKPQHNFATQLNETPNTQVENEADGKADESNETDESDENGNENDRQEDEQSNSENN